MYIIYGKLSNYFKEQKRDNKNYFSYSKIQLVLFPTQFIFQVYSQFI